MLDVFSGSTRGSGCTIHARSARGAVRRFEQYGLAANPPVPVEAINYGLAEAAPIIVHLAGDESGPVACAATARRSSRSPGSTAAGSARPSCGASTAPATSCPATPCRRCAASAWPARGGTGVCSGWVPVPSSQRGAALTWRCSSACSAGSPGSVVLYAATAWSPAPPARVATPTDWRQSRSAARRGDRRWRARPAADGLGRRRPRRRVRRIRRGSGTVANRRASVKVEQARIEALASWCEQLRDLLTAEHGIVGTIAATARTCPEPIRPEVERLATRLSRQNPDTAIRQFAAELDDPSGDLVASVLLLAMSRSSRTSELLSELAGTIRERAAMRLRVEADRAGQRSEARFIIAFSAVAVTGVVVFGRDSEFLDAYDDAVRPARVRLRRRLLRDRWLVDGEADPLRAAGPLPVDQRGHRDVAGRRRRLHVRRRRVDRWPRRCGRRRGPLGAALDELNAVGRGRPVFVPAEGRDPTLSLAIGRWLVKRSKARTLADEQTAVGPRARRPPARGVRRVRGRDADLRGAARSGAVELGCRRRARACR